MKAVGYIFIDAGIFKVLEVVVLFTEVSLQQKTWTMILKSRISELVYKAAISGIHCVKCPYSLLQKSKFIES